MAAAFLFRNTACSPAVSTNIASALVVCAKTSANFFCSWSRQDAFQAVHPPVELAHEGFDLVRESLQIERKSPQFGRVHIRFGHTRLPFG